MKLTSDLITPTHDWIFDDLEATEKFAVDFFNAISDTMYPGASANQCGTDRRVIAFKAEPDSYVCFNPVIVYKSPETSAMQEISPTYPGIVCKVRRSKEIRVRFNGPDSNIYSLTFKGLTARIVQQLIDSLDGVPFYSRANRFHREKALKRKDLI